MTAAQVDDFLHVVEGHAAAPGGIERAEAVERHRGSVGQAEPFQHPFEHVL
jgi:hypothetical protein